MAGGVGTVEGSRGAHVFDVEVAARGALVPPGALCSMTLTWGLDEVGDISMATSTAKCALKGHRLTPTIRM